LRHLEEFSVKNIPEEEQAIFIEVAEDEILALHEGNFARYRIRPSEFDSWQKIWNQTVEVSSLCYDLSFCR